MQASVQSFGIGDPPYEAAIAAQLRQCRSILSTALVCIPLDKLRSSANFRTFRGPHSTKAPPQNGELVDQDLFQSSLRLTILVQCAEQSVKIVLRFVLQNDSFGKYSVRDRIVLASFFALRGPRTGGFADK